MLAAVVLDFLLGLVGDDAVFSDFHFEAHARVFVDEFEALDREMLGVVGEIGEKGKSSGDFGIIPERRLGLFYGIDEVIIGSLGSAVAVPEFIGEREPVGSDGQVEDEFVHAGGKETSFEGVVGSPDWRRGSGRSGIGRR